MAGLALLVVRLRCQIRIAVNNVEKVDVLPDHGQTSVCNTCREGGEVGRSDGLQMVEPGCSGGVEFISAKGSSAT